MVNKPKAKGTAAETAVVCYLKSNGFPDAQRLALAGVDDQGDVEPCPGVVVEVKAGAAAETASDAQIATWLEETERERRNRGAQIGVLIRKRKGKGAQSVDAWYAHMPGWAFVKLSDLSLGYRADHITERGQVARPWPIGLAHLPAVGFRVDETFDLLRRAGYGAAL